MVKGRRGKQDNTEAQERYMKPYELGQPRAYAEDAPWNWAYGEQI